MNYWGKIISCLIRHNYLDFLSDEQSVRLMWWITTGKKINLDNPKGFNEKLNWIKLYARNPIYSTLADKYKVRDFVKEKIGGEYLIPLLGVWDDPDNIDFDSLPEKYVLKCNHNSGDGMIIVREKQEINTKKIVRMLKKALKKNYYYTYREWQYKNIPPVVIAEKYMEDLGSNKSSRDLINYKFYCFNGDPKFLYVSTVNVVNNKKHELMSYYLTNWEIPPFSRPDHPKLNLNIRKPDALGDMLEISRKLAEGIPFARIDLYYINKKIYFSEITLTPGAGLGLFEPAEWEFEIGSWIDLP